MLQGLFTSFIPLFAILLLLGVGVALVKILIAAKHNSGGSAEPGERDVAASAELYRKRDGLFTPAERSFLGVLDQAIGDDHRIFGKVRLADLVEVKKGLDRKSWQKAFNRIQSKHIDFAVCRADDLSPVLLIELDDQSHSQSSRADRDQFVDAVLKNAGLPLLRVPARKGYALPEIKTLISERLETSV